MRFIDGLSSPSIAQREHELHDEVMPLMFDPKETRSPLSRVDRRPQ
jgi:hypothetical protein